MTDAPHPPAPPPYPPAPPSPLQPPASQRFPSWKQALVMFLGGSALAISACFGCLIAVTSSGGRVNSLEGLAMLLALLAGAGTLAAGVGVVLVLMRILRALFAKKDQASS